MSDQKILDVIYQAIDEVNIGLEEKISVEQGPNTLLYGDGSILDSLGLVTLIVNLESLVEDTFNTSISLTDEKAMSQENSPFQTVSMLASYIETLMASNNG